MVRFFENIRIRNPYSLNSGLVNILLWLKKRNAKNLKIKFNKEESA